MGVFVLCEGFVIMMAPTTEQIMKYKACRINFVGGPGIGKSTIAAKVYAHLKSQNVQTELVKEYVKDWTYIKRGVDGYDQTFLFANQLHLEDLVLNNHPDTVLVSESPILMNSWYGLKDKRPAFQHTIEIAHEFEKDYPSLNFILKRSDHHSYSQVGRYHTLEESTEMDASISDFYKDAAVDGRLSHLAYFPVDGDIEDLYKQIDISLGRLKNFNKVSATITGGSRNVAIGSNNSVAIGSNNSAIGKFSYPYSLSNIYSLRGTYGQPVSGEVRSGVSIDESESTSSGVSVDESEFASSGISLQENDESKLSKIYHNLVDGAVETEENKIVYHSIDSSICPKCNGLGKVQRMKNIVTEGSITYWRGDLPREPYDVDCPNCEGKGSL